MHKLFLISTLLLFFTVGFSQSKIHEKEHTFEIGKEHFLLDNTPFQIRCGEIHFARVPKEYWRHRIQMIKALGMNTICAYLFWNFHERSPGNFKWDGEADIAEFCKIAQEEGMWVILRPGPYACAEWEMGGLPWWLLKNDDIKLRTTDPLYIKASQNYLNEVGRILSKLQITNGGPIIMVQVENEYGFYGNNADYMGIMRDAVIDAGFNVPLFSCNPTSRLKNGFHPDLFPVVNFGANPEGAFKALREILPEGPLMCGEFYSGWFDTWGTPHSYGKIDQYLKDMEYMLKKGASFSIYMSHGGTTFGFWAGADRPFKPDVSSYDYGAPVSEAGWVTDKFIKTRSLISKNLMPGESPLPEPPGPNPMTTFSSVELKQFAPLFKNLSEPLVTENPKNMEYYNQGRGSILYRTMLPAGKDCVLKVEAVHDFAWIFSNGKKLGAMDRRKGDFEINIPARENATTIDILVHAMGRINFGPEVHDRKGLIGSIQFLDDKSNNIKIGNWEVFNIPYDDSMLKNLKFEEANPNENMPGIWSGEIMIDKVGDVFLDVSSWGKGVVWINGHCLGRYWNIGPTQTMYIPEPWLKRGVNKVLVLDLLGPEKAILRGLDTPILNDLHPEKDFSYSKRPSVELNIKKIKPNHTGQFLSGGNAQTVNFSETISGRYFCFEALSSFDEKPFAAIAEMDILDTENNPINHENWKIAYVSSEELEKENGSAENAIDGQIFNYWHSSWGDSKPDYPHYLVIDLGKDEKISGFRYVPRADNNSPGRIKDYQVFIGNDIIKNKGK
ncbi:beta-galactosidase [Flavobacteriaceae bacterium GSB9]|nr:beta-galactosidase [Flavobacteriaceae bacterium GSB9]